MKIDDKRLREQIFQKFNGRCAYCGLKLSERFQVDHITPVWRKCKNIENRGTNTIDNYNPSCAPCNASKSTWTIEEWRGRILQKYNMLLRDDAGFRLLVRFELVKPADAEFKFYFEKVAVNG